MSDDDFHARFYVRPLTAYLRSVFPEREECPLGDLIEAARERELSLRRFKRTMPLRRVSRVLGMLEGMDPADLLDVGTGRGNFLWPLLESRPDMPVTAIDTDEVDADILKHVASGIGTLTAFRMDARRLDFEPGSFDVVTALEMLEHMTRDEAAVAASELIRVARRFVIVTVPNKPDDNPEHLHVYTREELDALLREAGADDVTHDGVLNHRIAIAKKRDVAGGA